MPEGHRASANVRNKSMLRSTPDQSAVLLCDRQEEVREYALQPAPKSERPDIPDYGPRGVKMHVQKEMSHDR
jgi:hypothetical protein